MLLSTKPELTQIPLVDVRDGGAERHAREGATRARALRDECVAWFPAPARPLVPLLDMLARRWLRRSKSPYVAEIGAIAATLGFPGVWFLNGSYQWSCTALAREEGGAPWLVRTLDWPFPGLGRHVEVAHMRGAAGEFFNVTWPGYVGALTAMAPGRFAAAVNQAPLKRRSRLKYMRVPDIALNAVATYARVAAIPPDQLLRRVFETCRDYGEAKLVLERTPIARPVIFTLAGCRIGERCVIERTETQAKTRGDETCAANDWLHAEPLWEARIGSDKVFKSTFDEARQNSVARREALAVWPGAFARDSFAWIEPPVLNRYTRLGVEMCPARGVLRAIGFELEQGREFASPATLPREIQTERQAA
jgi:hypothetical protein